MPEETQEDDMFGAWAGRPALEIVPTTDALPLQTIARLFKRLHPILEERVLEWQFIVEDGSCTYRVCAEQDVLDRVRPILEEAFPAYSILPTEIDDLPEVDEATLDGVMFNGSGIRKNDWQVGPEPLVDDDGPRPAVRPALTSVVNALANEDATVIYQAQFTAKDNWKPEFDMRCYQLTNNRDSWFDRLIDDWSDDPSADNEETKTAASNQSRIEKLDAVDPEHSFEVTTRALAWGPDSNRALDILSSTLTDADGSFYRVIPKPARSPIALAERLTERTPRSVSLRKRLWRSLWGSGIHPWFVADPRAVGQFCLIDGGQLTDRGKRLITATPAEQTPLPEPAEEILKQFDSGFSLGLPQTATGTELDVIAVPPTLQRRHMLLVGATGYGKTVLGLSGVLTNHGDTEGPTIIFAPKGDGMPLEYMRMHYAKYGSLDDVVIFDAAETLPATSFFDLRPQMAAGITRQNAVENIADHYIEVLEALMGRERFRSANQSPAVIRHLVKALFDPVHGSDAYSHRDLRKAVTRMKATGEAPPVVDEALKDMLDGVTESHPDMFNMVMSGVETRINTITSDSRLSMLFNHVSEDDDDPHFAFDDLLDEDKVIIFDTSSLRSHAQDAMTIVLFSKLWTALQRRPMGLNPLVNLHVEEAASVATSGLMQKFLSEGRGFDLSVTLSFQYPAQLRERSERAYNEVLNNVGTVVSGRVSVDPDFPKRFANEDLTETEAANRLSGLSPGEWMALLPADFETPQARALSLKSAPLPPGHPAGDEPLTEAMQAAFESARDFAFEDSRENYGMEIPALPSGVTDDLADEPHTNFGDGLPPVLTLTKRFPDGIEYEPTMGAFTCSHSRCDARYEPTTEGLQNAVECHYGLDRTDRDKMPLSSLSVKLTPEELAATSYSASQLYFLQAVYDAQQLRFDPEWEYDITQDSMVRLQEYTGLDADGLRELIDDGLVSKDCERPYRLYTVTADGRHLLNESHKSGITHGDGIGDLGESSFHVAMVLIGIKLLLKRFVENPDSDATRVEKYYDIGGGSRLDAVALDDEGNVIATFEAERINHDSAEAILSDYDKMADLKPEAAIWLVENRQAAHKVLQTLNDPNTGPVRVEQTYSETTAPREFNIETDGLTEIDTYLYARDTLLADDEE